MPRNSSGVYSLPAGNPVVSGAVIASTWANTTMSDLATAMTGSLARNGDGGMTGQLKADAGAIGAPGVTWSAETTSGWYRASAGNFRFAIGGADVVTITSAGISDGSLSSNVPLKDAANVFTDQQTFQGASQGAITIRKSGEDGFAWYSTGDAAGLKLYDNSAAADRLTVGAAGNWTINAPGGGYTLRLSNNGPALSLDSTIARNSNLNYVNFSDPTGDAAYLGFAHSSARMSLVNQIAGSLVFGTNNVDRIEIGSAGNVTISAPGSGNTLALTQGATARALTLTDGTINGSLQTDQIGLAVAALSDHPLRFYANSGTFRGAIYQGMVLGAPTGGDKGAGTLNTAGTIYQNDVPVGLYGTYTPTVSGTSNVASSTALSAQYSRVGNTVTVSGVVTVGVSATGVTTLELSLPVASNFSAYNQASGTTLYNSGSNFDPGFVVASPTNDTVVINFNASVDSGVDEILSYTFTYTVL